MGENYKFSTLTSEVLQKNEKVYTDILDFGFRNNKVKNIAITGIYGAGKSTVWETYVHEKSLQNVLKISVGKFEDDSSIKQEVKRVPTPYCANSIGFQSHDNQKNDEKVRVERQILNQIIAQIDSKNAPLMKYKFKRNKKWWVILLKSIFSVFFFALCIDIFLKSYLSSNIFEIIYDWKIMLFFIGAIYLGFIFFKHSKLKFNGLNFSFKGAEATVSEDIVTDESLLDRDLKEIVYLIECNKTEVVVIEDLDRYDDVGVFTKLREINLILNQYSYINCNKKIIRFVYLLKDGLFVSKDRTKFFDLIVPIVPVVDSKSSENVLDGLLEGNKYKPDANVINKISLYIDDMRVLRNIINEFIVYSNIIKLDELKLDKNKLFAIVVLKNIFPKEFDNLQSNEGFIYKIFLQAEEYRKTLRKESEERIAKISQDIKEKISSIKMEYFEKLTLNIPPNVSLREREYKSWVDYFEYAKDNPEHEVDIYEGGTYRGKFNFTEILSRYNLNDIKNDESLIQEEIYDLQQSLSLETIDLESLKLKNVSELLAALKVRDRDIVFDYCQLSDNKYFPLIKMLILEGLLDETFWYYKGCFHSGVLGNNDTIFLKSLIEGIDVDITLELESPAVVFERLEDKDFNRFNILNISLLFYCLYHKPDYVSKITSSVRTYERDWEFSNIFLAVPYDDINRLMDLIAEVNSDVVNEMLDIYFKNNEKEVYQKILLSVFTREDNDEEVLASVYASWLEKDISILNRVDKTNMEVFFSNMQMAGVKFPNLSLLESLPEELLIHLEQYKVYEVNEINIREILKLSKETEYGKWIQEIMNNPKFTSTKDYIVDNYKLFLNEYIFKKPAGIFFDNGSDITIQILNMDIPNDLKMQYVKYNVSFVENLKLIERFEELENVIEILLKKNQVKFTKENLETYLSFYDITNVILDYVKDNLSLENYADVIPQNYELYTKLLNLKEWDEQIIKQFQSGDKITMVNTHLSSEYLAKLIDINLIEVNLANTLAILKKDDLSIKIKWIEKNQSWFMEMINEKEILGLIDDTLLEKLLQGSLSEANLIKIIRLTGVKVKLDRVPGEKQEVMEEVLNNMSTIDIENFIANSFSLYDEKDYFVRSICDRKILDKLSLELLTEEFIQQIFNNSEIEIQAKLELIDKLTKQSIPISQLQDLISRVDEWKGIELSFLGNLPKIDSDYKKELCDILEINGYGNIRKDGRFQLRLS